MLFPSSRLEEIDCGQRGVCPSQGRVYNQGNQGKARFSAYRLCAYESCWARCRLFRPGTFPTNARTPHLTVGNRSRPHSQLTKFPGYTRGRKRVIIVSSTQTGLQDRLRPSAISSSSSCSCSSDFTRRHSSSAAADAVRDLRRFRTQSVISSSSGNPAWNGSAARPPELRETVGDSATRSPATSSKSSYKSGHE